VEAPADRWNVRVHRAVDVDHLAERELAGVDAGQERRVAGLEFGPRQPAAEVDVAVGRLRVPDLGEEVRAAGHGPVERAKLAVAEERATRAPGEVDVTL